jgi:hypothetical protein
MTLEDFHREATSAAFDSAICEMPIVRSTTPTSLNLRIPLTVGNFIDMFYNQETETTAFALIKDGKRIFGADNTGAWHVHLFEKPEAHEPSEPISAREFVRIVERHYTETSKSSAE